MSDRSRGARLAAAVAGFVVLTTGWLVAPATYGVPAAPAVPAATGPLDIELSSVTPTVITPHSSIVVSGYLRNAAATGLTDVTVSLTSSRHRITTRYDLGRIASSDDAVGTVVAGTRADLGDIAPNARAPWSFTVDADSLRLGDFGAYPIAVKATAEASDGETVMTALPTFLPWIPRDNAFQPTRIAWLWPLADDPADTGGLADSLRGGRLKTLLDAGALASFPLTWLVDPALLGHAAALPAPDEPAGQAWLTKLRTATHGGRVLTLPYADPDVVALVRARLDAEIGRADQAGLAIAQQTLGTPTVRGIAVPPGGVADQPTLDALATYDNTVLLRGDALPPSNSRAITGARADIRTASGPMRAVFTDPTLDDLLSGTIGQPGGPVALQQRYLAETLLVTEQRPGAGSTMVVAPPTRWHPADGLAAALLHDTASVPWLTPVTLSEVAAEAPDGVPRAALNYPRQAREAELPASDFAHVAQLRTALADYSGILATSAPGSWLSSSNEALLTTESVTLRGLPDRARDLRDALDADVAAHIDKVHIAAVGHITLTSSSQQIPVTVVNDLDVPVRIGVQLSTRNPTLLNATSPTALTIAAHRSATVQVDVQARRNGRMQVQAQLQTRAEPSRPYGTPVSFTLDVTAYGTVALTVTMAAAGLLFVAAGLRLTRRIQAAHRNRRAGPPA